MSVLVRAVRADDFAAIAAITNHYIATSSIHFGYAKAGVWRERVAYPWTTEVGWKQDAWHSVGFWQKRLATDAAPPPGAPAS